MKLYSNNKIVKSIAKKGGAINNNKNSFKEKVIQSEKKKGFIRNIN